MNIGNKNGWLDARAEYNLKTLPHEEYAKILVSSRRWVGSRTARGLAKAWQQNFSRMVRIKDKSGRFVKDADGNFMMRPRMRSEYGTKPELVTEQFMNFCAYADTEVQKLLCFPLEVLRDACMRLSRKNITLAYGRDDFKGAYGREEMLPAPVLSKEEQRPLNINFSRVHNKSWQGKWDRISKEQRQRESKLFRQSAKRKNRKGHGISPSDWAKEVRRLAKLSGDSRVGKM